MLDRGLIVTRVFEGKNEVQDEWPCERVRPLPSTPLVD